MLLEKLLIHLPGIDGEQGLPGRKLGLIGKDLLPQLARPFLDGKKVIGAEDELTLLEERDIRHGIHDFRQRALKDGLLEFAVPPLLLDLLLRGKPIVERQAESSRFLVPAGLIRQRKEVAGIPFEVAGRKAGLRQDEPDPERPSQSLNGERIIPEGLTGLDIVLIPVRPVEGDLLSVVGDGVRFPGAVSPAGNA